MYLEADRIIPYFQPIIAADTRKVYSYEVLGRYIDDDGNVKSLGPFFMDDSVSSEEALRVDRIIRKKAMKRFAEEAKDELLFINMRLDWISRVVDTLGNTQTISWAKEVGISLDRIVIEIIEEEYHADQSTFAEVISTYKKSGFKIAIDDYGDRASDIDRLTAVKPDIIKFDMHYIHKSENSRYYREYLRALTSFAERVGIEVLYEGIENAQQLDICIGSKGRLFQGFYLGKPQHSVKNSIVNKENIEHSFDASISRLQDKSKHIISLQYSLDERIRSFLYKKTQMLTNEVNLLINELCQQLPDYVERIYVCNEKGHQISCNFEIQDANVSILDYRNKNWIWRRYFQDAVKAFVSGRKSYISGSYRDVTTKKKLYTYVFFVNNDRFIFVDTNIKEQNAIDNIGEFSFAT